MRIWPWAHHFSGWHTFLCAIMQDAEDMHAHRQLRLSRCRAAACRAPILQHDCPQEAVWVIHVVVHGILSIITS